jgi:hypothetical protein
MNRISTAREPESVGTKVGEEQEEEGPYGLLNPVRR